MGQPAVGAVVLINFPFADLKGYKKRPALVVARGSLDTFILCQITSRQLTAAPGVKLVKTDFEKGSLPAISYARPDKLFTVDSKTAAKQILGQLKTGRLLVIKNQIAALFN